MTRVARSTGSLAERFALHVQQGPGCWAWNGSHHPTGYAIIGHGGRQIMAHRLAYELHVGPIPAGLYIDHLCRNRGCVNPQHLEPVTNGTNCRECAAIADSKRRAA